MICPSEQYFTASGGQLQVQQVVVVPQLRRAHPAGEQERGPDAENESRPARQPREEAGGEGDGAWRKPTHGGG